MGENVKAILAVLMFGIIPFLSFYNANQCRKIRKFYLNHSREVHGTITSFYEWVDQSRSYKSYDVKYYDIDVAADDGRIYHISTDNRKARKYKYRTNIFLLVPDQYDAVYENDTAERLVNEKQKMIRNGEHMKAMEIEDDILLHQELTKELLTYLGKSVIIKDELRSNAEYALSIFLGVFFTAFTIMLIYALCIWK